MEYECHGGDGGGHHSKLGSHLESWRNLTILTSLISESSNNTNIWHVKEMWKWKIKANLFIYYVSISLNHFFLYSTRRYDVSIQAVVDYFHLMTQNPHSINLLSGINFANHCADREKYASYNRVTVVRQQISFVRERQRQTSRGPGSVWTGFSWLPGTRTNFNPPPYYPRRRENNKKLTLQHFPMVIFLCKTFASYKGKFSFGK